MQNLSLNHDLISMVYDAASIRRWNDQINPMDFTELDKQSHKMVIAWVLAKYEEERNKGAIQWRRLIEGGIFEMLHRILLTDIKPPVFHKMMAEKGAELNAWVLQRLEPLVKGVHGGFFQRMRDYFFEEDYAQRERRILKAAHFLATQWEFKILYKMCPFISGIEQIRREIEDQLEDHYDLIGVQKLSLGRKTAEFVELCGQLRFQKRWSQSPRIPATSVLGHTLIVAILTYLSLCENDASDARIVNSFFGGLFHDLPEVLTRDITSPVKEAVDGLDLIIKEYEKKQMEDRLLPLLPSAWHRDIRYYTEDEFANRAIVDGKRKTDITFEAMGKEYSSWEVFPVDGEIIRCCDHLAAFIEAALSISGGISSRYLVEGVVRLYKLYNERKVGAIDYGEIFRSFLPTGSEALFAHE